LCCVAGSLFVRGSTALRLRASRPQLKRDPLGSALDPDMPSLLVYAILAATGLATGVVAHRVRASVHGSLSRHLLLAPLLEGLALLPGFTLAGFLSFRVLPSRTLPDVLPWVGTFVLTYVLGRFAGRKRAMARAARREAALPFEHWLALLRTHPEQARQFLNAYLARARLDGTDLVAQLTAACASLEERGDGDPLVHRALETLRAEITRSKQEHARLPGRAI